MIKLHLGCGKRNFGPDWEHIDSAKFPHVTSHDVKNLPYSDNRVDLIYACHLIAYFDRVEIVEVLKEWKRVLKPGGILRIATPDFKAMAKLYVKSNCTTLDSFLGPLYGKMGGVIIDTPSKCGPGSIVVEQPFYHKTTYDLYSLIELLSSVGFKNIRKYNTHATEHSRYDDHSKAYVDGVLISLNVQCYG